MNNFIALVHRGHDRKYWRKLIGLSILFYSGNHSFELEKDPDQSIESRRWDQQPSFFGQLNAGPCFRKTPEMILSYSSQSNKMSTDPP